MGHPTNIFAAPTGTNSDHFFRDTPHLVESPYLTEVLNWFQCDIGGARLMLLGTGAKIKEHSDQLESPGSRSEWRIHIPIQTHQQVCFMLNGEQIPMQEGEIWYANFNLPHAVTNNSPVDRVHLVVDCFVNDWLIDQVKS